MDEKEQVELEKREARRKRRKKNQIISYCAVAIFVILICAGVFAAVHFFTANRTQVQESQEESQSAAIDDILASEEEIVEPSEEESQAEEMTAEQKLDSIVEEGISVMPLEDKVAGLFIVTPESITGVSTAVKAGEGTQTALSQYAVGGIVYAAKNIQSEDQIAEMLDNTSLYTKYPIFLAIAEEGGSIAPVQAAGLSEKTDGAKTIGETGDAQNAYSAGTTIGAALASLGFNLNFAPVADLSNVENSVMAERSFGADATSVSEMVTNMVRGMEENDVTACLKYFPGQGGATSDPEKGLSTIDRSEEEFRAEEFAVFQAGIDAGAQMIMVSLASAPALTGDNEPCIFSESLVTDVLRKEMGYDGVIITDALTSSAISDYYAADEAAIMALRAGCDMILAPEDFETAYTGVLEAVENGQISEERINDSLKRIYRIKYADRYGDVLEN